MIFRLGGARRRLLPLVAPLVIILGALAVLGVAGVELVSAAREYVQGARLWSPELLVHALLAAAVTLIIVAVLMTQQALARIASAEDAVRESEARLRLVANNVPALISYVDREQRFRFSNRTYDDWFGIAASQMEGRLLEEVFGKETYESMRPSLER